MHSAFALTLQVTISNAQNETVQTVTLPATVELKKKKGYLSGQQYHLKAEKKGYEPHEQVAETTISAWYFGNILIGGAIGMLAIDPVTGAMWTFKENEFNFSMQQAER